MCQIYEFIRDWQTLLAGLLALGGAAYGAVLLNKQIRQSDGHEQQRRASKAAAARAILPLTLSTIGEYAQDCADVLAFVYSQANDRVIPKDLVLPEIPRLPEIAIRSLQELIETSDDGISKGLARLIAKTQIQGARIRSVYRHCSKSSSGNPEHMVLLGNIETYLCDTAIIYARATSFFEYARQENDNAPEEINWKDVCRALMILGIHDHRYPLVYERINRFESDGNNIE